MTNGQFASLFVAICLALWTYIGYHYAGLWMAVVFFTAVASTLLAFFGLTAVIMERMIHAVLKGGK